ncbi:NAD(P)/FAD-dependent oxidoreductase [Litoribacter ruber]|uniref:NAD(P)/FAD-dependent oxidoreductase n=1 Tax=Litoribacter ruber TaxID=702568 RepID=A0AAP2CKE6_9BACT|nr:MULTISPECIES: NAD(P)/FAD-dependent oxidoreductase [Litoribacter]MBS9525767.1 NAD(P)/FAD-dependent oxidoreductase [Litoribacter alkaliphilus]MBT0810176.1 NAD(P)/FAD-dependent oxidoreductase [Litoribacter ruber]
MIKVGVIGGGAAGYFAAITAAQQGAQVTIFEKSPKTLSKVKVSGGGRCNVTHDAREVSKLIKSYPRGEKFLKKVFRHFAVPDTIEWFESRGVTLKTEADGRMFPITDSSQTIINALRNEADKHGVVLLSKTAIDNIEQGSNTFDLYSVGGKHSFDKIIITTGGAPKLASYQLVENLGHTVEAPLPSLFTFNTPSETIKSLPGLSVPSAHIKLEGSKLDYTGPLLITHWGVSGPAVLKLSAFGAKWLAEKEYKAKAHIRWDSEINEEEIRTQLTNFKKNHPKKKIISNPLFNLPARLWEHLCEKASIENTALWLDIPKKQFNKLVECLFNYVLTIEGKTTFKEEFVTAGGVDLSQVDPNTMESKIVPGVFFAGEVLNIDGITGGFNFQAAWSTGFLAGVSVLK